METVSFEIAKKLKEKGFYYPCFDAINAFGCTYKNGWCEYLDDRYNELITLADLHKEDCLLPTISQVLKWLREEKDCHIMIDIYDNGWFYTINNFYRHDTGVFEVKTHLMQCLDYDTYEQAALAGIEYVLDNLI